LQDKAHVLSDHLGQNEEALGVMDRAVALHPDHVPARLGRGVLRARLGRRAGAHADARECLARDNSPATLYQAADVYALTARQEPADRPEALALLSRALGRGYGLDLVDRDPDLDPIRAHPDFRRVVTAARALRAAAGPRQ
jgi:hypothetical protein